MQNDEKSKSKSTWPTTKPSLLKGLVASAGMTREDAWSCFVDRYGKRILSCIRRKGLADDMAARDVCQELLIALFMSMPSYDRKKGRFRQWIQGILKKKVVDYFRRCGRAKERTNAAIIDRVATEFAEQFHSLLAKEIFELLKEQEGPVKWKMFEAVILNGQSVSSVADEFQVAVTTVYSNCRRISLDFIQRFGDAGGDIDEPA